MNVLTTKKKSCLFAKERYIYMRWDVCPDCQTKFGRRTAANLPCLDWGRNNFPAGRNFMFIPKKLDQLKDNGGLLSHIINVHIISVQVMNTSSENVYLFKNNKLSIVQNYEKENCYLINAENFLFTANFKLEVKNWLRKAVRAGMVTLTAYQAVVISPLFIITEIITQTSITIYGDFPATQIRLIEIAEIYPRLWENDGLTVRVPPEKWMFIDILPDVRIKTIKIYP